MKIEEVIEIVLANEKVPVDIAMEVANYGVSELLKAGATYNEALLIIERSELSLERARFELVSFVPTSSAEKTQV